MPNAIASGMATVDETSPAAMSARAVATPGIGVRDEVSESMRFHIVALRRSLPGGENGRRSLALGEEGRVESPASHCSGTWSLRQSRVCGPLPGQYLHGYDLNGNRPDGPNQE